MEKNKKVNKGKVKGPNYYKGKNNNTKIVKKKKATTAKEVREEVISNDEIVDEEEKFKFYENTMAINLEGKIDINDDIVDDFVLEPEIVDIKEVVLDNMKEEDIKSVDSVNVTEEANNDVQNIVDVLTADVKYDDIVLPEEKFALDKEDELSNTEVLDIDEIRYQEANDDALIPEMTTEAIVEASVEPVTVLNEEKHEKLVEEKPKSVVTLFSKLKNSNAISNDNHSSNGEPHYYNFETRVTVMSLLAIVAFIISGVFIYLAVNYTDVEDIVYNEMSTINYSACYVDNDYYHGECLSEGMQYISALTKNIPVTFNYNLTYSSDVNYDIQYYVLGKTVIYDRDDATLILFRDDKILVERTSVKGNSFNARINTKVDVPFKERNDFVNGYKSKYALNALASYEVVLYADDGNGPKEVASLEIPLSTQTFNITEETVLKENQSVTMQKVGFGSVNTVFGVLGIIFVAGGIFVLVKLIILVYRAINGITTAYQKKLSQILTEFDRVIVISRNEYKIDPNKQFIKVDSFYELLDARDALEKPIVYERVNSVKSFFYVEDNDKIYRYVMKESDFEKK